MKIFTKLLLSGLILFSTPIYSQNYAAFREGYIGNIKPQGWLKESLERQANGLTGHPEALDYPYNTCLWAGEIERRNENPVAKDWWRYEQTAYYTDGLLKLGYLLDQEDFIKKGEDGVNYTISNAQPNGRLGNQKIESLWPMVVFARAMKAKYEVTRDSSILYALQSHYLSLDTGMLTNGRRHILNLEGILYVYGITKNPILLSMAEKAYAMGGFELDAEVARNVEPIKMHGVTYAEMLKIPLLLYAYTGKQHYLDLALNAERKLERDHLLPDGLYTSAEFTLGNNIDIAHETCDIVDYTWSLGYFLEVTGETEWADRLERAIFNAGFGAITKDFRALQYFSSLNQFICTGTSDNNEYKRGSTWMAYRPIHETECCVGNVNRIIPNFASRLWMTKKPAADGEPLNFVATLYAPNEFEYKEDDFYVKIKEETQYPFDDRIKFRFSLPESRNFGFTFRIPKWAKSASLKINDVNYPFILTDTGFITVQRDFADNDVIDLFLEMETRIVDVKDQGKYVERGPLLYSYAIPQTKIEDSTLYENMNGKSSHNPDFKSWGITPAGPFNFGIDHTLTDGSNLRVKRKTDCNYNCFPFDIEATPISLVVPVRPIEWHLDENERNPLLPKGEKVIPVGETEEIELVPYGATELRLTVFPIIE